MSAHKLFLFVAFSCVFIGLVQGNCNIIKPKHLRQGDTVAMISPASPYSYKIAQSTYLTKINSDMSRLGLNVIYGAHMSEIDGQWAGPDANRAADVDTMFANTSVKWMLSNRGGSGCLRILQKIDFDSIRNNPKIIMGYSDLTGLLNAIHTKTGLVTFHGPMGTDTWLGSNNEVFAKSLLFDNSMITFKNPTSFGPAKTLKGGKARGKLLGGNISLFTSILNTEFLVVEDWSKVILFLEETGDYPYELDNNFAALNLSGVLNKIAGFVWGTCQDCTDFASSHTIQETVESYIKPLNIPAYTNAMIGHNGVQFTLPIGVQVEIDGDAGSLRMLEQALV